MERIWSYIKDSGGFIEKIKRISNIQDEAILIMANIVELYPSTLLELGLKSLKEVTRKKVCKILTSNLVKMAEFIRQNKYFYFNGEEFLVLPYALNVHLLMHVYS